MFYLLMSPTLPSLGPIASTSRCNNDNFRCGDNSRMVIPQIYISYYCHHFITAKINDAGRQSDGFYSKKERCGQNGLLKYKLMALFLQDKSLDINGFCRIGINLLIVPSTYGFAISRGLTSEAGAAGLFGRFCQCFFSEIPVP